MPARNRRVHLREAGAASVERRVPECPTGRAHLRDQGFTLIEAAVAILVIAILAGAMAPLATRALAQQREYRTRDLLRQAYEGCFGARDRRVANMRADFGFDPTSALTNLQVMVNRTGTAWNGVSTYPGGYGFLSGWNGPYWTGPVNGSSQPVDAWGGTLQLTVTSGAWQLVSGGKDRTIGTADDLVYPTVAVSYLAHNATLTVQVTRSSSNITGTATLSFVYGTSPASTTRCTPALSSAPSVGSLAAAPATSVANTAGPTAYQFNVPAGAVYLQIAPTAPGSFTSVNLALDLLPGENRTVQVTL